MADADADGVWGADMVNVSDAARVRVCGRESDRDRERDRFPCNSSRRAATTDVKSNSCTARSNSDVGTRGCVIA